MTVTNCRNTMALACAALIWCQAATADGTCVARSPEHTVALLELYTSEGCSSCPPADRWLSRIMQSGLNPSQVVPLALHVDYWDNLGWKDRFATPAYTQRQHILASRAQSDFVYTPEIFLGGQEFRQVGADGKLMQRIAAINALPAAVSIEIKTHPVKAGILPVQMHIELKPGSSTRHKNAYIVIYENALTSRVNAGENRGADLHHDFVVRRLLGPYPLDTTSRDDRLDILLDPQWKTHSLGIAAFVEDTALGAIMQAVATDLCTT